MQGAEKRVTRNCKMRRNTRKEIRRICQQNACSFLARSFFPSSFSLLRVLTTSEHFANECICHGGYTRRQIIDGCMGEGAIMQRCVASDKDAFFCKYLPHTRTGTLTYFFTLKKPLGQRYIYQICRKMISHVKAHTTCLLPSLQTDPPSVLYLLSTTRSDHGNNARG